MDAIIFTGQQIFIFSNESYALADYLENNLISEIFE